MYSICVCANNHSIYFARPEQDTEPVAVDKKITPRWQQRLERSISQQPDRQDSISSAASCMLNMLIDATTISIILKFDRHIP